MKRAIGILSTLALLLGAAVGVPVPAVAGEATVGGEGWSATVEVADLQWEDCWTGACQELDIWIDVEGSAITRWEVDVEIWAPDAADPRHSFYVEDTEPGSGYVPDVTLCYGTDAIDPPGVYDVTGEVRIWTGTPDPSATESYATTFHVLPMPSETEIYHHEVTEGLTTFYAVVWPSDPTKTYCSQMPGTMVLERRVGTTWVYVRDFWYTGPGSGYYYAEVGGSVTGGEWPPGTVVRGVYLGNNAVAPSVGAPYTLPALPEPSPSTTAPSAPPAPVAPVPVAPSAPQGVSAVAGDASATVSWAPPANPGTSPVTGYTVIATPGGAACVTAALTCAVAGLVNQQAYTFTVVATSAAGQSSPATVGPVVPKPFVKIKVKAKKARSVLYVDINPNLKKKRYWRFRIQKQTSDGSWMTMKKSYKSVGSKERRTVNLKKGTYRVVVLPKRGYQLTVSPTTVRLKK